MYSIVTNKSSNHDNYGMKKKINTLCYKALTYKNFMYLLEKLFVQRKPYKVNTKQQLKDQN